MTNNILIICMGNLCRSPTAEAVLRAKATALGIEVNIDSAGLLEFHQGALPDPRSQAAGEKRGYSFQGIKARQVVEKDFESFDLILSTDQENLSGLFKLCPKPHQHKLRLFLSFGSSGYDDIPDPYYGGHDVFELVLDLIEDASESLLRSL
ncbi:low molecular weight protein-tyrosine-phosphatase [Vibrio ostreicida]|uniref:protein-tyrosine-phosphatase n=1 Tax=Vibrio ostreicida TaxID=526588 RepID=A0ABT8BQU4_9VIBR|nr:low molecular weight protein-tyrosine-phosphatase [Vibrio ostreicida]MDN3609512.1 low molecular weight protein-tyrosine-phosphatase [Vibrio ostreicida]NPD08391.1 low molecular weight phosphotyrosine protein phosphatase [Vibrio ostreicida]